MILTNVYSSETPIFTYYDSVIASKYKQFKPEYSFVNISVDTMNRINDAQNSFTNLRKYINIKQIIKNKHILQQITANVWIGNNNVIATTHYDAVYNVYIQLTGSKRFRL